MHIITPFLPLATSAKIAQLHGLFVSFNPTVALFQSHFKDHMCNTNCIGYRTILSFALKRSELGNLEKKEKSKLRLKSFREKKETNTITNKATPQLKKENESFTSISQDSYKAKLNKSMFDPSVQISLDNIFPPDPLDRTLAHQVIKSACDAMDTHQIEEAGCAVCGQLVPKSILSRLSAVANFEDFTLPPQFQVESRWNASTLPGFHKDSR
jgi:hypothetical protein